MLSSLVTAFRQQYPQGSLVSELTQFQEGQYVVRAEVQGDDRTLATALAADSTLEIAEDRALERALWRLALPGTHPVATTPHEDHPPATRPQSTDSAPPSVRLPVDSSQPSPAQTLPTQTLPTHLGLVPDAPGASNGQATAADQETVEEGVVPRTDIPAPSPSPRPLPASPPPAPVADSLPANPEPAPFLGADLLTLEGLPTPSIDLSDIIAQTDVELQRLGWTVNQGREFLEKTYGKRSRHDLTDEELLEFLLFLETQPNPGS